jgi:acylphosphatase
MQLKRFEIVISGRVHGVGFRFFSREAAKNLGLTGWVRNSAHRTVEIEVQGDHDVLKQFCDRIRQGPRLAHVENVKISDIPVKISESSFDIFH